MILAPQENVLATRDVGEPQCFRFCTERDWFQTPTGSYEGTGTWYLVLGTGPWYVWGAGLACVHDQSSSTHCVLLL